jgi:hypothetical protein
MPVSLATFTRLLIARWWQSNLYTVSELMQAFRAAGFSRVDFPGFPLRPPLGVGARRSGEALTST